MAKDMHKPGKKVADWGGIIVVFGALTGIFLYIGWSVFLYQESAQLTFLLAALSSLLLAFMIGYIDDTLGWKVGLKQHHKLILSFMIAIPIIVVNAGESTMNFPLFGSIHVGLFYPLLLVPLGIVAAANAFNILAGYNGLETGMGIIMLSVLSYLSWATGQVGIAIFGLCTVAALLAFLFWNWYPAKIFPGDSMTYFIGTLIAIIAILGNIEKFAAIVFIPYILQTALKFRGRLQKESFGKVGKNGRLVQPYKKFYGLEHIMIALLNKMSGRAYEWQVTVGLLLFESIFAIWALSIFLI